MNQDFLDLLRALSDADARFLIVGAYAVGVHGHPRTTDDLLINKRAAGRPQDIADVSSLEELQRLRKR